MVMGIAYGNQAGSRERVAKEDTAEHQIRGACDQSGSESGQAGAWLKQGLVRGVKGKLV